MSEIPENLLYASTHEWVKVSEDGIATVGITDFAQSELGDVVFVELPEVGSQVNAKDEISVVESVKAASDINTPISGEITAVNEALQDAPELINSVPYDGGWIFKVSLSDESELAKMLSNTEYGEACADD